MNGNDSTNVTEQERTENIVYTVYKH